MVGEAAPRIGLICDSDLNRHILQSVLRDGGYEVPLCCDLSRLRSQLSVLTDTATIDTDIDAWLIDLGEDEVGLSYELLEENTSKPMLLNDHLPPVQEHEAHQLWRRRLLKKLETVAVRSTQQPVKGQRSADSVWVLAASLGGPEAVKEFLAVLPAGLPLAMVYAQHIESSFDQLLTTAVGKQEAYPLQVAKGEQHLRNGEVTVVPVDSQLHFMDHGRVVEIRKPWQGQYQPAIDQVIAELARVYRKKLGVIVFSGMCNDGEIGCRVARANGATVWAQSPGSCICPAMPEAALSTGAVSYQATPAQLAESLARHLTVRNRGHGNVATR